MSTQPSSLFLDAANCLKTQRPPIWMMRQAGRYMDAYQQIRKNHDFLTMIKTPELAAEITLQPIERFGFDAAILFSDILVVCEALGFPYKLVEKKGPIFDKSIETTKQIDDIDNIDVKNNLGYVFNAIKAILPKLTPHQIPLIGFSGAPFTLASYMIEGKSSPNLLKCKTFYYQNPKSFHKLLDKIADVVITYLNLQIEAGVKAVQIFDTWACHLNDTELNELSISYISKIINGISDKSVPVSVFCKGSSFTHKEILKTKPSIISLDWNNSLKNVKNNIPKNVAIQGNLDPLLLFAPKEKLTIEVNKILNEMKDRPGYIFNLGHGILPKTPIENVELVVKLVQSFSNTK
ncbi:uroporphyrinogen decarboxylase [bacterium]|jgi:uroporphyrinogen decarboxylase|nr:uroporphyrinogen decarboxylase [bacterium]